MTTDDPDALLASLATSAIAWRGFDAAWYRRAAGPTEAGASDADLIEHYLAHGRHNGFGPNPYFAEAWYRARNPDVTAAIAAGAYASGYEHYCATGYLTRSAHWLYDDDIYSLHAPDLTDHVLVTYRCANRYDHYLKAGAHEHRLAHLLFQPAIYCAAVGEGLDAAGNPFSHYLRRLSTSRSDGPTSLYFDPAWYLAHCPPARDAIAGGHALGALHHFLTAPDAGDPLSAFSARHYRQAAPEAVASVETGACTSLYDHFLKRGVHALLAPAPGIDLAAHLTAWPDARRAIEAGEIRDLFAHYLLHAPRAGGQAEPETPSSMPGIATRSAFPSASAAGTVELDIDSTIRCPPDAILINGWMLAPPGLAVALTLLCGDQVIAIEPARRLATARDDILDGYRARGYNDPMCGFIAFVPGDFVPGEPMFLEARLPDGTTAMRKIPAPALHGLPAIRALLDGFDLRYDALAIAMDHVVAPAMARLGAAFNAQPLPRDVILFGAPPASPGLTLIIPLHGRLDFMEYQLALFSRGAEAHNHDIIYVLDDPPKRRAAEVLAASCLARFGVAFRLVVLGRNAGYAAANNVGLALAHGRHVALVNSDIFPTAADDFDRLAARLDADPGLGAVGPLLLFEDGAVQHQGMAFARLPEYAGLHFPLHPRKGLLPPADHGLHEVAAITGACMVLPRDLLQSMNGLDEVFLIGDFEDADLCLRLAAAGRRVAVDHGVRMHHLERQSQAGAEQRWRMNLTLSNAWTHEQRWGTTLAASDAT